jgi:hypothetical protein
LESSVPEKVAEEAPVVVALGIREGEVDGGEGGGEVDYRVFAVAVLVCYCYK